MITASFISTVMGAKLPGPRCISLRQDLRLLAQVRPSDTEHAQITITDVNPDKKRVFPHTGYRVGDPPAVVAGCYSVCGSAPQGCMNGAFHQRRFSACTGSRRILRTKKTICVFFVTSKRPRMT